MSSQQKFFLYSEQADFQEQSGRAQWRADEKALMLMQNQQPRLSEAQWSDAHDAWLAAGPMVVDAFAAVGELIENDTALGFRTHWQDTANVVEDEHSKPIRLQEGVFTDLHLGGDSRLSLGISDVDNSHYQLGVLHLRKRWFETIALAEAPLRVWTDAQDQTWVLSQNTVFQCAGQPLPHNYALRAERFEPENINPQKLRVIRQISLPEAITQPLALCEDGLRLYVLAEVMVDAVQRQQVFSCLLTDAMGEQNIVWQSFDLPGDLAYATDMHPVGIERIALMLPKPSGMAEQDYNDRDCPVLQLTQILDESGDIVDTQLELVLERYPMLSQLRPRFVSSEDRQLRYLSNDGPRELFPLAQARFFPDAEFNLRKVLDSGIPDTHWHKIVMDACIPRGCQVNVMVYCTDSLDDSEDKQFLAQHKPLWRPLRSELAFHEGWGESKPGERGVFEILLQRPDGEVRELRGRYLQLRMALSGDGRSSPAIHSIRVYYPRLCWQENFLPQHFHQQKPVDKNLDPENPVSANGADIRQRIFASLESMLTPIENRIAASEYLFDPQVSPPQMLPVVAATLGLNDMPEQWPEVRQRRLISEAGRLQQRHGTYAGLVLALDIATDGALAAGQIVVLENFRFRRTLATILGISLDDRHHPLTLGSGQSGNSIVGDSLILTKKGAREFLALLSPQSYSDSDTHASSDETSPETEQASESTDEDELLSDSELVENFFDKYAHRITVLLHGEARRWQHNVEAVLQKHAPAHLQWTIKATDHPFVLGLAPLLQIDTYLEQQPEAKRVVLNQTQLGREGLIRNESALSPSSAGTML